MKKVLLVFGLLVLTSLLSGCSASEEINLNWREGFFLPLENLKLYAVFVAASCMGTFLLAVAAYKAMKRDTEGLITAGVIVLTLTVAPHIFTLLNALGRKVFPDDLSFLGMLSQVGLPWPLGEDSVWSLTAAVGLTQLLPVIHRTWEIVVGIFFFATLIASVIGQTTGPISVGAAALVGWIFVPPFLLDATTLAASLGEGSGGSVNGLYLTLILGTTYVFYLGIPVLVFALLHFFPKLSYQRKREKKEEEREKALEKQHKEMSLEDVATVLGGIALARIPEEDGDSGPEDTPGSSTDSPGGAGPVIPDSGEEPPGQEPEPNKSEFLPESEDAVPGSDAAQSDSEEALLEKAESEPESAEETERTDESPSLDTDGLRRQKDSKPEKHGYLPEQEVQLAGQPELPESEEPTGRPKPSVPNRRNPAFLPGDEDPMPGISPDEQPSAETPPKQSDTRIRKDSAFLPEDKDVTSERAVESPAL